MTTESELGGMQPQAQGRLEPPKAGRGRKNPPPEPAGGTSLPTPCYSSLRNLVHCTSKLFKEGNL